LLFKKPGWFELGPDYGQWLLANSLSGGAQEIGSCCYGERELSPARKQIIFQASRIFLPKAEPAGTSLRASIFDANSTCNAHVPVLVISIRSIKRAETEIAY